jgi:hypothetical protein
MQYDRLLYIVLGVFAVAAALALVLSFTPLWPTS